MSSRGRGYKRPRWTDAAFAAARQAIVDAKLLAESEAPFGIASESSDLAWHLGNALRVMDHDEGLRQTRLAREKRKHREYREAINAAAAKDMRDWRGAPKKASDE